MPEGFLNPPPPQKKDGLKLVGQSVEGRRWDERDDYMKICVRIINRMIHGILPSHF